MNPTEKSFETPRGTGITEPVRTRHWSIRYYDELVKSLPEPGEEWKWRETELPHRLLYVLKEIGHIEKVDSVERLWYTTSKYWDYLQAIAVVETSREADSESDTVLLAEDAFEVLSDAENTSQSTLTEAFAIAAVDEIGGYSVEL